VIMGATMGEVALSVVFGLVLPLALASWAAFPKDVGLRTQLVISTVCWVIAVFSLQGIIYPEGVPHLRQDAQVFFFVACPAYMFFFCVCAAKVLWRTAKQRPAWATASWVAVLAGAQFAPWTMNWSIPALAAVLLFTVSNLKRAGPIKSPIAPPPPALDASG
jgi:hypothetical protein